MTPIQGLEYVGAPLFMGSGSAASIAQNKKEGKKKIYTKGKKKKSNGAPALGVATHNASSSLEIKLNARGLGGPNIRHLVFVFFANCPPTWSAHPSAHAT